jgi:hypothetical protein
VATGEIHREEAANALDLAFRAALARRGSPLQVVDVQVRVEARYHSIIWTFACDGTAVPFLWGAVVEDRDEIVPLNLEVPTALRGRRVASQLNGALASAARRVGLRRLRFDAGQMGAVLWARQLPHVRWDHETMSSRLPVMLAVALARWPHPTECEALTALVHPLERSLVEHTGGPYWFVACGAGVETVPYDGLRVTLGEYVLTREGGWRGVVDLA